MVDLVYKAPAATSERFLRHLPNSEVEPSEVDACFHVALDLPGYGRTPGADGALEELHDPEKLVAWISDVIRSVAHAALQPTPSQPAPTATSRIPRSRLRLPPLSGALRLLEGRRRALRPPRV